MRESEQVSKKQRLSGYQVIRLSGERKNRSPITDHFHTFSLLPRRLVLRGSHFPSGAEPTLGRSLTSEGFTLVELMVAVAILAIIMVAFFTIFKGGISAWQKGDIRTELVQNGRIALDRMASEIRQALLPDSKAEPPIEEIRVCKDSDCTTPLIDEEGDRIIFEADLDTIEGPEEIRFSLLATNDSTGEATNTLYKRVDNPPCYDDDGEEIPDSDRAPESYEVTAGDIVTNLTFKAERKPQGHGHESVLITIGLTLENEGEKVRLTTKVKVAYVGKKKK